MKNITEYSSSSWDSGSIDCEDLTNNNLYILFVGYVLPLLSPRVRDYGRELLSHLKNAGKVAGDIVSVTEYGFEKIQDLSNNGEMVQFIQKVCDKKKIDVTMAEIKELSWRFSGDTENGKRESIQQTWKSLLNNLNAMRSRP
tara:strand:- start:10486 stop:10911 length:426 start_codon:yes stop_codon:yes gene_type:complete